MVDLQRQGDDTDQASAGVGDSRAMDLVEGLDHNCMEVRVAARTEAFHPVLDLRRTESKEGR